MTSELITVPTQELAVDAGMASFMHPSDGGPAPVVLLAISVLAAIATVFFLNQYMTRPDGSSGGFAASIFGIIAFVTVLTALLIASISPREESQVITQYFEDNGYESVTVTSDDYEEWVAKSSHCDGLTKLQRLQDEDGVTTFRVECEK